MAHRLRDGLLRGVLGAGIGTLTGLLLGAWGRAGHERAAWVALLTLLYLAAVTVGVGCWRRRR